MKLLRDVRDRAPRFRLLFPHPTADVRRRLDDGLGLGEDWLVREGKLKHRAPRDIASAVTRTAEAVADLRGLVDPQPAGGWRVRPVADTNMLLDDPDATVCKDVIGPRYRDHLLPAGRCELGGTMRAGRNRDFREAAKRADRRLKGLRVNGDFRTGARVVGDV